MCHEGCLSGHYWYGTSMCSRCGERLRCDICRCYVREDNIDAHYEKHYPPLFSVWHNSGKKIAQGESLTDAIRQAEKYSKDNNIDQEEFLIIDEEIGNKDEDN